MTYKNRYTSERVNEEVNAELQSIIWKMYELLEGKRKDKMDNLQIFDVFNFGDTLMIKNRQEKPLIKDKLLLKRNYVSLERITIWIIMDKTNQIMLMPSDY